MNEPYDEWGWDEDFNEAWLDDRRKWELWFILLKLGLISSNIEQ